MTNGERVRAIRKQQDMSQEQFGSRLGVTKVAISNIENGNRSLTDQMVKSICKTFNISEEWLRSGIGPMSLIPTEDNEIKALVSSLLDPNRDKMYDVIIEFMKVYASLSPNSQKALNELADKLLEKLGKQQTSKEEIEVVSTPLGDIPKNPEDLERLYPPVDPVALKSKRRSS